MITSGNGCRDRNHIYITSWIEKLHQKTGDASSATRMGSTNVKIVLASHSIAWAVAGVNIVAIHFTGSVNGTDDSSSGVAWLMSDSSFTLAMMATNVRCSQICGICSKKMNRKTSLSLKICHLCQTPWSSSTSPVFIAWRFDAVIAQILRVWTFKCFNMDFSLHPLTGQRPCSPSECWMIFYWTTLNAAPRR